MAGVEAEFLIGPTMRHVVRMTITGSIGITFMFAVDAANLFWVSLLGKTQLVAALGFAWTLQFFTVSFGIGMMVAVTATVSRLIGQRNMDDARRQTTVAAITAFVMQGIVATGLLLHCDALLTLAGARGETLELAKRYLMISVPSLPILALGMVGSAALRAKGDAYRAMMVTLSSGAVSMLIDPLLIYGLDLELDGAAIAVVLARIGSAVLSIYFILRVHKLAKRVRMADFSRLLPPLVIVAIPAILTQLSTPFGNYIVTAVIADYGDGAVAGWALISRLTVLAFGGLFALSAAIGGIFGQNYGAGEMGRVRQTYRDALIFCALYTLLAWTVLWLSSDVIIQVFGASEDAARLVRAFSEYAAGAYLFIGALFVGSAAFNALGKAYFSTVLTWFRDGIILWPILLIMSARFQAEGAIYGHALSGVITGLLAGIIGWVFVRRLKAS